MDDIGIKETKELAVAAIKLGSALGASLNDDGKLTFSDAPKFIGAVLALPAAFSGITEIPTELSHLTPEEEAELIQQIGDELELPSESVKGAIVDGLKLLSSVHVYLKTYFLK